MTYILIDTQLTLDQYLLNSQPVLTDLYATVKTLLTVQVDRDVNQVLTEWKPRVIYQVHVSYFIID